MFRISVSDCLILKVVHWFDFRVRAIILCCKVVIYQWKKNQLRPLKNSSEQGTLIHLYYPLFRSIGVWWCKPLKIVWKEFNRRKSLVMLYAKPTSLRGTSPNHLEAMYQSERPHQWQTLSTAIKLPDQAATGARNQRGSPP